MQEILVGRAMPTAVALFSGGLDSTLAIRILQEQGFQIEALNIRTTFDCCRVPAAQAAQSLGVNLTVLSVGDDYIDLLRHPRYGYGKGMNPCVDCRIYMARMAKRLMDEVGACVVITGEILGQRPMSQKRPDLANIERHSGLEGRLLRPLSAQLLPPTIPEQEGLIDRQRLYGFRGRSRGPLIELARRYGLSEIPPPSTGCALTEVSFAPRVRDLVERDQGAGRWDFELLNVGRHFRLDPDVKAVVGRNEAENASLEIYFRQAPPGRAAYVRPHNFVGPDVLLSGLVSAKAVRLAGALILRYSKRYDPQDAWVQVSRDDRVQTLRAEQVPEAEQLRPL
ncbi:MAG TPA: hypothetical protein EYP56_12515 [Planctomycetaceae bacterium]|nr:hypothetical protein [Planctomycetaceae bacterium]